jgi:hypothetical protein
MNVHKWGLFDQGTTILKVSYMSNNYKFYDSIPLRVEINNMRGKLKVKSCEVKIYRKVGFRKKSEDKNKYEMDDIIASKIVQVLVDPMNQKSFDLVIQINDKDKNKFNYKNVSNPYPNIVDISYLMPSTDGVIIKCDYRIVVTLYYDSFVTSGYLPKVTLPFSVTHQTQNEYNIEKQEDEDLQRAIEASKLDIEGKNNNNVNMSCVDNNKMDDLIDKPDGYEIQKMEPISRSQLIDSDNNILPSKNEIENNDNKNQIKNNPSQNINNMNQNNYGNNNQMNNNNININQNNYGNNIQMNNNKYMGNCPPPVINRSVINRPIIKNPVINNKNGDDDDDLFNPYMPNQNPKSNNNINNQMKSAINNNYPNINYQANRNFNNNQNQISYINNNNNNQMNNMMNNNNANQLNNIINNNNYSNNNIVNNGNVNNNYPNVMNIKNENDNKNINNNPENNFSNNNNQMNNNEINNRYPNFNNLSNNNNNQINDNTNMNNNISGNKEDNIQDNNDFSVFDQNKENNKNNENQPNNEGKSEQYYDINEL